MLVEDPFGHGHGVHRLADAIGLLARDGEGREKKQGAGGEKVRGAAEGRRGASHGRVFRMSRKGESGWWVPECTPGTDPGPAG